MNGVLEDMAKILVHVDHTIGRQDAWGQWPGGWAGGIETALVDAVFSARAVYRPKRGRGIYANIAAWHKARDRQAYSLDALLAEIDFVGPLEWASLFGNLQTSPGRPASAPYGSSKAATVRQAARTLHDRGINDATRINTGNVAEIKQVLRSVPGIGYATTNYFLMLLGAPGVKPDRMIHRFLRQATGHSLTNTAADQAIQDAARRLSVQPHELDHAIWCYESERARQ